MKYLLDSDAITAFTNMKSKEYSLMNTFLQNLEKGAVFYICILTIYEMEYSISAFRNKEGKEKAQIVLESLKENFQIINLGFKDAKIYGELKQGFKKKTGINKNALKRHNIDIALASVAIANNCILISSDSIYSNHLQKINNRLECKNWK